MVSLRKVVVVAQSDVAGVGVYFHWEILERIVGVASLPKLKAEDGQLGAGDVGAEGWHRRLPIERCVPGGVPFLENEFRIGQFRRGCM